MKSQSHYELSAEEEVVVQRTLDLLSGEPPEPLSEPDRNAMRAFLQRAETRLSTYQRVAGVFLNGAGLLILLPGLARESVSATVKSAFSANQPADFLLLIPWLVSTCVPLYAFLLLLRDLVQFYFSPSFLEQDPIRITRFSLAGVTFPYDESMEAKSQVIATKVSEPNFARFILGGTSAETVAAAHQQSRAGKAAFPLRLEIMERLQHRSRQVGINSADQIGVALSLAGSLDLSLVREVARMEASVARHVLLLRKLVLRYSKALLLFVWTTLISMLVAALLAQQDQIRAPLVPSLVQATYAAWAFIAAFLLKRPIRWIDRLILASGGVGGPEERSRHGSGGPAESARQRSPSPAGLDDTSNLPFHDRDLKEFEANVLRVLYLSAAFCILTSLWMFPW